MGWRTMRKSPSVASLDSAVSAGQQRGPAEAAGLQPQSGGYIEYPSSSQEIAYSTRAPQGHPVALHQTVPLGTTARTGRRSVPRRSSRMSSSTAWRRFRRGPVG